MHLSRSAYDSCIYYHFNKMKLIIVAVFVDDLLVFSNSVDFVQTLKENLRKLLSIKDLGPVKRCLGIDIIRDREKGTIVLSQSNYVQDILKKFNMHESKEISTPMECAVDLSVAPDKRIDSEKLSKIPYQSAVGALIYLTQATRPDLAYAVSSVSRFNNCFTAAHWEAVKRIFRYLRKTQNYCLQYAKDEQTRLIGYSDASWGSDKNDPRSISGYIFMIQGGAIS